MSENYTVRLNTPITDETLRKFSLEVSAALTRLGKRGSESSVVAGESLVGKTGSWAIALYDEETGAIAFLPGVRFVPVGADDVNIGFELDVSPRVGSEGISGTSQGYMANYGTVGGSKLAAGMSANNEDVDIPRLDLGFKPGRGATMEFYGNDGTERNGELRATLGPDGKFIVFRNTATDTWKVFAGFDGDGALACGLNDGVWPATALPAVVNVFDQAGGTIPVATIDKNGKLKLGDGVTDSVAISPPSSTGNVTLTLQEKEFNDGSTAMVLCATTVIITFDKQSGTGGSDSVTGVYGSSMPSATAPTRALYTFDGYYDIASGGTQYYTSVMVSALTWDKTSATTLYAQWVLIV